MSNWIEELYTAALEIDLPPEVVRNMEVLPELLTTHLAVLKRYGYIHPSVTVIEFGPDPGLRIDYTNHLLGRKFVLIFNITELYPQIWMWIIRNEPRFEITYLEKYFIQKSNRKVSYENFKLSLYAGNIEGKVKGFSEFLIAQFRIRGLFWLDGTGWMDGYGMDI